MMLDGHTYINIDAQHIKASSPRLLAATVESPEDMVLLWDEAVNRLAREQSDLLSEMGLQAPEDTIQVGNTLFAVSGFFVCFCTDMCLNLPSDVGGITKQQCDLMEWACKHQKTPLRWVAAVFAGFCLFVWQISDLIVAVKRESG
jgi:hypothetical protein